MALQPARMVRVDIMTGIAMILIVVCQNNYDFAPDWFGLGIIDWMSRFLMEVFLFLMAFQFRKSNPGIKSLKEYFSYFGQSFSKLFIPFLLVGVAIACASAWSLDLVRSDSLSYVLTEMRTLLLYPYDSQAGFLWILYVLFGFSILSPLMFQLPSWIKMTLCILSIGLPMMVSSHLLCGNLFCQFAFFYFLGILCAEGYEQLRNLKTWMIGLLSIPFLLWSVRHLIASLQYQSAATFLEAGPQNFNILSGSLALVFFYFLGRLIENSKRMTKILTPIAVDWIWILLLQMFIGMAFSNAWIWAGWNNSIPFIIFMIVNTALCILLPLGIAAISRKAAKIKSSNRKKSAKKPTK